MVADVPYMSNELCVHICVGYGDPFAGTMSGTQCFCGTTIRAFYSERVPASSVDLVCSTSCGGNSNDICGGSSGGISITSTGIYVISSLFEYSAACWFNNFTDSALSNNNGGSSNSLRELIATNDTNMTNDKCFIQCSLLGYTFAGTVGGGECQCFDSMPVGSHSLNQSFCLSTCFGNTTQLCGGPYGSMIESVTTFGIQDVKNYGCWQIATNNASSTPPWIYLTKNDTSMTSIKCSVGCLLLGYNFSSIPQGGVSCRCFNQALIKLYPVEQGCGGIADEHIYSMCSESANMPVGNLGCWEKSILIKPVDVSFVFESSGLSNQVCATACFLENYLYSATSNGNQCYCANAINTANITLFSQSQDNCKSTCTSGPGFLPGQAFGPQGSDIEKCGGKSSVNVLQLKGTLPEGGTGIVGCDGVYNSGNVIDSCGVCAGLGVEVLGCDGVCGSGAVFDSCGVCNGYGGSCCGYQYQFTYDSCKVCGGQDDTCLHG